MGKRDVFGLVGTLLDGRYRVECVAGEGGFGVVYRATHVLLDGPVAIKVLKMPESTDDQQRAAFAASFREEGKLLFQLSSIHSSIVQARETGVALGAGGESLPYLALEWLDGIPLDEEIRYRKSRGLGPMSIVQALRALDPVAQGLAIAHKRGIAHRDIKPGNIFLVRRYDRVEARLLDFGLAKVLDHRASLTAQLCDSDFSDSVFTRRYGAPEQWLRRLGATGPWTDVHAFAAVLVELLTLDPALAGDHPAEWMAACLDREVRPTPNHKGACLPEAVNQVFARALAISPRERFHNIGDFWRALRETMPPSSESAEELPFRAIDARSAPAEDGAMPVPIPPGTTADARLDTSGGDSLCALSRSRDLAPVPDPIILTPNRWPRSRLASLALLLCLPALAAVPVVRSLRPTQTHAPSALPSQVPHQPPHTLQALATAPPELPPVAASSAPAPVTPHASQNVRHRPSPVEPRPPHSARNEAPPVESAAAPTVSEEELSAQEILRDRK